MRPSLLAVLAVVSLAAPVHAQQPKTDQYLLLVAAAVSGYSAGGQVWVVICQTGSDYKVIGAYGSEAAANEAARAKNGQRTTCTVEGPYVSTVTYAQGDMQSMAYGSGCKKGPDSDCVSDSTRSIVPIGALQSVTITYSFRDNRPPVIERFDPRTVEAIFFTMSAVDRMLVPYYVRVYGLSGALTRRRALLERFGAREAN
jgi:hypothetical protein